MFNVSIPKLSDGEIMRRYQQIKPIARELPGTSSSNLVSFREFSLDEVKNIDYMGETPIKEINNNELEPLKDFVCLHSRNKRGYLKAITAEILAQIDEDCIPLAVAFRIISDPEEVGFFRDNIVTVASNNGYDISTVRLYKKKNWY